MKKAITISLSPNTQCDDVLRAWKVLLTPWSWRNGKAKQRVHTLLKKEFPQHSIHTAFSGRSCLYALLKAFNIQSGDEVLVQSYTCVAVPGPILWTGAQPVYVDIDPNTLNMSPEDLQKKISPHSKVLIIQHTLGNPANIEELIRIARQHKLLIIEDCAHAFGAQYHDKPVGTFGDAAFFSFGRDKVISSVFGGFLIIQDHVISEKIELLMKQYYITPSYFWIIQQLLHPIIFAFAKPLYGVWKIGKGIVEISKRFRLTSKAVYASEKQGKQMHFIQMQFPNALAQLAEKQLKKIQQYNHHRKIIASLYNEYLDFQYSKPVTILPDADSIYLRYTITTPYAQQLMKRLRKYEIYLGDWYTTGIAPQKTNYKAIKYEPSQCPEAEKIAPLTVNLPTHIGISKESAIMLARLINQELQLLSSHS